MTATSMIAEPTARRTGTVRARAGPAGSASFGSGRSTATRVSFVLTGPRWHDFRRSAPALTVR